MASSINASLTAGLVSTADTTGDLNLQSGGTTRLAVTSTGVAVTGTLSASGASTFAAGSAAAPSIAPTGDSNTGIFFPAADTIAFTEGGTEAMRIDSSANLTVVGGIGATGSISGYSGGELRLGSTTSSVDSAVTSQATGSPAMFFDHRGTSNTGYFRWRNGSGGASTLMSLDSSGNLGLGVTPSAWGAGHKVIQLESFAALDGNGGATYLANNWYSNSGNKYIGTGQASLYSQSIGAHAWFTAPSGTAGNAITFTQAMTLDASGNLLVGGASAYFAVKGGIYQNSGLTDPSRIALSSAGGSTLTTYIGNQSITTSSDIRLKENVKPTERNAIELLSQWEIVDHTWNDPSDQCENNRNSRGVWTGVVAQQVQPITPWLVNKPLVDVEEDGTINTWTMDFGYAVPLLVKAIQELKAIVDTQAEQIKALQGAK